MAAPRRRAAPMPGSPIMNSRSIAGTVARYITLTIWMAASAAAGPRHWRYWHAALDATAQDDLERSGVGWPGEHVVGLLELIQREAVGDKPSGVDVVAGE